jgi:NADH-quinone oxidoreductase subunit C
MTDETAPASNAEEASDDAAPEPELCHGVPVTRSRGQRVAHPSRAQLVELVRALHQEGYLQCLDVTGVDYLAHGGDRHLPEGVAPERFEVVYQLINHGTRERIRLRVQVPADDAVVPSLFAIHPGTEAPEREVFDMFGVRFAEHPDLTRILMPEDWVGHPLRKDTDAGRIPVQFKAAPASR